MDDSDQMFTAGEYEAARVFVACLSQHAVRQTFKADSIGFTFLDRAEQPAGTTDGGVEVTGKDFIRAALKLMLGQLHHLEVFSGYPISHLIGELGVAVAIEDPGSLP